MSIVIIRRFLSKDRVMVRQICCDTADKGEPIENFFPDRAVAADLLCAYYTDYEPEAIFVAEDNGHVIGYVFASFDNRRYGLVMFLILIPKVIVQAFMRGVFFQKLFWVLIQGMLKNFKRLFSWRKESFHSHQGHMHIGIVKDFRGEHVGQKLVAALLDYARTQGVYELTASVHDGNKGACHFFEQLGFKVKCRHPMVMAYQGQEISYQSLLYAKNFT